MAASCSAGNGVPPHKCSKISPGLLAVAHEGQGAATLTTTARLNSLASIFSSLASCIMTAKPGGGQGTGLLGVPTKTQGTAPTVHPEGR